MTEQTHRLPPIFQKNEVLFGHDGVPGLIAFEVQGDKVTIVSRAGNATRSQIVPFQPFLLAAGDDALAGWKGEAKIEPLAGQGAFNCLVLFPDLQQLDDARYYLQKKTGKTPSAGDARYWVFSHPLQQFLLLSGKTHFLDMAFHDLRRMQLGIETYCA